jgi:hypothetical protein
LNRQLHLSRVIPTLYDTRTSLSKEVLADIKTHFGDAVTRTVVRKNVRLAEAPSHGRTILEYAPNAVGARDFMDLARELLEDEEHGRVPAARSEPEPEPEPAPEAETHDEPESDVPAAGAEAPPAGTAVARSRFNYLRRRQHQRARMNGEIGRSRPRSSAAHKRARHRSARQHAPTRQRAVSQLTPV